MSYKRSFRHIRTHVLIDGEPSRESVFAALREGRCYIAMDSLAPARGFTFEDDGGTLRVRCRARRGSACCATARRWRPRPAARSTTRSTGPGAYRVEAYLPAYGRERTWILSNPIYVRSGQPL